MTPKQLKELADELFSKKLPLNSLHQELAENFYPERATFTVTRSIGNDFAANLMSSYPVLCRRDMGDQFGSMMRPTAKPWFHIKRRHYKAEDNETLRWLQYFEEVQRAAMYDTNARLTRATKEGDNDIAAFGQCAISVELNSKRDGMLYRCWHLRDMCWQEGEDGQIAAIFRRWKPHAREVVRMFPKTVHANTKRIAEKTPFEEVECLHMVIEADMYDDKANGKPRFSVYYDVANDTVLEATPIWGKHYVIPRWQTVSGSQYSYSPATVAALPDARLIQAMTYTLLSAGERSSNPPMVATQDAVRSDIALYPGGVTWVDMEYDERLGDALRPITQDFRGVSHGLQLNADSRQMIHRAFYLDAMSLPARASGMSEYEVGERVQEYIRRALPLFEPLENEYNAALCEETFGLLKRNNAFGPTSDMPKTLVMSDVEFTFESPLHDAIEQARAQELLKGVQLVAGVQPLDPSVAVMIDVKTALRDALNGIGFRATWMRSEEDVLRAEQAKQQEEQKAAMLAALQQGSQAVGNFAGASKDMAQARATNAEVQPLAA